MIIALTGMPGSGKTSVGRELLKLFPQMLLTDIDEEIVRREKRSINEIFAESGEKYFRDVEAEILDFLTKFDNLIISTGGGIVLRDKNLELLKERCNVVYLKTSVETLVKRVSGNNERPLLNTDDIKKKLTELLRLRESMYEDSATVIIDTEDKTPEEIAKEAAERWK